MMKKTERSAAMTREEIFAQLYSSPEIYPPPMEHHSAFLEVTIGCSYRKCRFCDFPRDGFRILPMAEIARKIELLRLVIDGNPKLHLLGCNPFCLHFRQLLSILEMIRDRLPCVREVSMYARADDVLLKGEGAMARLRAAGLTELHVGVESGSDLVLQLHNKGESVQMLKDAFRILEKCGIAYHMTLIPGLGGAEHSREHCIKTAQLLSTLHPISVWCMALKIWPNTRLQHMVKTGDFYPMSYREILLEEREMIERTEFQSSCLYVDSTVLGEYTVMGFLPEAKDQLLGQIDGLLNLQT